MKTEKSIAQINWSITSPFRFYDGYKWFEHETIKYHSGLVNGKGIFYIQPINPKSKKEIRYALLAYGINNDTFPIGNYSKKLAESANVDELKNIAQQKLEQFVNLFL